MYIKLSSFNMDTIQLYNQTLELLQKIHTARITLHEHHAERIKLVEAQHRIEIPLKQSIEKDKQYSNADRRKTRLAEVLLENSEYQELCVQLEALDNSEFILENDCQLWSNIVRLNTSYLQSLNSFSITDKVV